MKSDDSIQITGQSGQFFVCPDRKGVGKIYAGMRGGLPCLVFLLSPGFSADGGPVSDIEGRLQHMSDNNTIRQLKTQRRMSHHCPSHRLKLGKSHEALVFSASTSDVLQTPKESSGRCGYANAAAGEGGCW